MPTELLGQNLKTLGYNSTNMPRVDIKILTAHAYPRDSFLLCFNFIYEKIVIFYVVIKFGFQLHLMVVQLLIYQPTFIGI